MSNKKHIKAGFVVDVGEKVGWGHYVRSRALALELISRGVEVDFHVLGAFAGSAEETFMVSSNGTDTLSTIENLAQKKDILVLDLYEFSSDVIERSSGFPVSVCIDDTSSARFNCDLLVNPNLNSTFTHKIGQLTTYLKGGDHIILRQQFNDAPKRVCNRNISHVFVAFGGTDPANLTQAVIDMLKIIHFNQVQKITVLVGDAKIQQKIKTRIKNDGRFQIIHNADNVCDLLQAADIGIIAAGTLLYEAAVTGLPCLVVSVNESQKREALIFKRNDAIYYLGDATHLSKKNLVDGFISLENLSTRQKMATKCQALIDAKGRSRIVDQMIELAENRLKETSL
jgi:spore coat polysaccharide biosynthesis predicted glycosyltransferase SpsG